MRNVILGLLIPTAVILGGCPGGDETEAPKPTIALSAGSGLTNTDSKVFKDSMVKFAIVATSTDKEIASVNITASTNGGTAGTIKDTTFGKAAVNYTYMYKAAGTVGDKITLTFTAVDKNGQKASTAIVLTVKETDKTLGEIANQTVYNSSAPTGFVGGYDLNLGTNVAFASPAATKDILDATAQGATAWANKWTSGHGTSRFAVISANDYNNPSSQNDLADLWAAKSSSATATIANFAQNTYYIVKTGQTGITYDIYLIKIDAVTLSAADKKDRVTFSYKKVSI